ncbi:MAG: NAD(P)H-dependent oxidoreductase [Pedobacter sp.]|nr:MAG: NAD(P)H-dependent oxidoreductase [Pedobacter sp.]
MSLIEALNWRYATKKMNGQKVSEETIDQIIEAALLAPTSSGLQPFEILVISNPELKEQLLPHAFNQMQVVDSSHILVFAAWDNYTEERINKVFEMSHTLRGTDPSTTTEYQKMLIDTYIPRDPQVNFEHAARQAYISFGMAIAAAASLKVDATPMEGFDNAAFDKILGLAEKGLKSVTILPIGYRADSGDWLVGLKKARKPKSMMVTEIK